MTSILTNSGAISALATLRDIDSDLNATQNHISSGYRIGSAADNASYWSIATTMRSDNMALATVSDALGLAAATVDTAYQGLDQSIDLITQIRQKLTAAGEAGVDKDKVQKEIADLKNQLLTVAQASSFSADNWLYNASNTALGTKSLVGSFTRSSGNSISVQTIDFNAANSCLIDKNAAQKGALTKSVAVGNNKYYLIKVAGGTGATGSEVVINSATSAATLTEMLTAVDQILQGVTDAAATLGAAKSRVDRQNTFVKNLHDTIGKGIGRLVDADMNEESTRLKALQTQQQLGIQALTIANSNASNILQLFR